MMEGGCDCGAVRYRMNANPMMVHCCHCRWCQRETGAAFALNAMIEADRVELLEGEPEAVMTPSASGKGQKIWRCPRCRIAVWSNYAGAGDALRFVRVGTLDEPDRAPPIIQYGNESRVSWYSELGTLQGNRPTYADDPAMLERISGSNHQHPDHDTTDWTPHLEGRR